MAAASTLLAFAIGGVVDLDPFSLNLWSAQAAAREAAKPGTTAEGLRQDALDQIADRNAAEQAAAAKVAQQEATTLGGVGTSTPPIGLADKDKTPALSPREAAIETAQRQAQTSEQPVVVNALTTETALTTAMPDGTMRTQTSLGPVRYRTDGGTGADLSGKASWKDLDLALTGQDGSGRTTAEAAGPWAARLAGESGAGMVAVGPAAQTISWSPQAVTGPVGVGGPGGALPAVKPAAPTSGVTPVQSGVDVQVVPGDAPALPGSGADAPQPVVTPTAKASTKSATSSATSSGSPTATSSGGSPTSSPTANSSVRLKSTTLEASTPTASSSVPSASASGTEADADADADAGSDAVFPGVLKGGRDYTVTVTATGAEESVVLASREQVTAAGGPAAAAVYRNTFTLPAGVTARQATAQGGVDPTTLGVEFVDASGAVIATFGGGKAVDSSANEVGEPATAPVATRLLAVKPGTGAGSAAGATGSATVEVSVDPAWVADSARVFPLTIDPHIATGTNFSGSTGPNGSNNFDAYVDEAFPTTNEGVQDSGRLLAGYRPINGGNKASTTLVYFHLGDLIGSENTITSAQFSVWNNYSYSCTPSGLWVDAATGSWNPATVTWNTRPGWANAGSMKTFAHGYSSSCAAAAEFYDVTPIVQKWANGTSGYYPGLTNYGFILTANGTDVNGYKRFNSAETGSGMPGLTVSWENCTNYPAGAGGSGTRKVCGAIRDDYAANGGPSGFGLPTTNDAATPNGKGFYNHFDKNGEARSIYWNQTTGAHSVGGAIRTRWAADGYETSPEGWPASDYKLTPSGQGYWNLFYNLDTNQYRYIYSSSATGTRLVQGYIGAKWDQQGREGVVGWPETEEVNAPGNGGKVTYFRPLGTDGVGWSAPGNPTGRSGGIYFKTGTTEAWPVHGRIFEVYRDLGETTSWLGYPKSKEYHPSVTPGGGAAPADAKQTDFENGVIYGDPRNGYTAVLQTGAAQMTAPQINQHTARRLPVEFSIAKAAAGATDWPARLSAPQLQYRRGAKAATGTSSTQLGSVWTAVPSADVRRVDGSAISTTSLPTKLDAGGNEVLDDGAGRSRLYWDAGTTLKGVGGVVDVRFVFTDSVSGQQVALAPAGGVEYDPDAGQSGTVAVGPGSVNLLTGALELSDTDASAFGISITRTANSRRTNAGLQDVAGSAFGPQWTLGGVDDDMDLDWTAIRQTSDYSLDVVNATGETTSFVVDDTGSTWYPENGSEDLTLAPIGASAQNPFSATSWTLTDDDGAVTTFASPATVPAPAGVLTTAATTNGMQATWQVASMVPAATGDEAGQRNATRYHYASVAVADPVTGKTVTKMRLDRIGAANPALSASQQADCVNTTATPSLGCRVLALTWAVPTGMASDAKNARVTQVDLWAGDPATAAETKTTLTTYGYDTNGQLTSVTDPRVSPALTTTYTYGTAESASVRSYTSSLDYTTSGTVTVPGRVLTVTPPGGQKAWTLRYGQAGPSYDRDLAGSAGRLLRVTRPTLTPGTTATEAGTAAWNVVYDVPLDTSAYGPYPMSAAALLTWGQDTPATDATAVFGPTAGADARLDDWTGSDDTSSGSARNWATAAVSYLDVNGYTVDTAAPSNAAGKWVSSGSPTADDPLAATAASGDSTRNGSGQVAANGTSGSNPAAGVTAIPVKGARISATLVDDNGNPTMSLTAANRALALGQDDPAAVAAGAPSAADQLTALSTVPTGGVTPTSGAGTPNVKGSATWLRAQLLSTQTRYELSRSTFTSGPQLREPTQVAVSSLAPLRLTTTKPSADGSAVPVPARAVTYTDYDAGRSQATNPQASELPTKVTTGFVAGSDELVSSTVATRYRDATDNSWKLRSDPASYAGVSGVSTAMLRPNDAKDANVHDIRYVETTYAWTGAAAGKPTAVKTSAATGDATETRTSYDVFGRVIAASMPRNPGDTSATGTASTTVTRYYGDASNGTNNCTTATAAVIFGGMVCSTGPANVQVAGSSGLPTSTTTYTRTGVPATVTETLTPSGSSTSSTLRTTTTRYDGADRPTSVTTTTNAALNVAAGTEVKTLTYDAMGNPDSTTDAGSSAVANGRTLTSTYDTLGRVITSTDATGLRTSTTYDISGRVATTTVTDTNTTAANTGTAAVTGYSAVTAGKAWKQTNTYDPITGDLTATTDEVPSGQASAGTMSMVIDVDGRTVSTSADGSGGGFTKKTFYDTTGAAIRRTVIAGGQTVLDDANAATLTSNGGGENVYGQQVESTQQLKAITRNSVGDPSGTTASTTTRHRRYSYDGLGRLVAAADSRLAPTPNAMSCTVRAWAYDADSNQTARASTPTSSSGPCAATGYTVPSTSSAGGNTLTTHSMNALDQITDSTTNGGYVYDGLGRTLTVPNGNSNLPDKTAAGVNGALSVTYAPGDMVASQTLPTSSGNEVQTFTLDPTGDRLLSSTTTLPGQSATTITNRYNDTDDNPVLINEADGTASRYVTGPDADMAAAVTLKVDGSSGLTWQVINLHGDVVATVPAGLTATATAAVMTDEFGAVLDPTPGQNNTTASRYDWLGGKQRSSNARAGLILMGARLYDPATARFLSVDPVEGGGANTYGYPTDPVNQFDYDGNKWSLKSAAKAGLKWAGRHKLDIALTALMFVPGLGIVAAGARVIRVGMMVARAERIGRAAQVSSRAAEIFNGWSRATFDNRLKSLQYHYAKHGKGQGIVEYALSGARMAQRVGATGRKVTVRGSGGGKVGPDGRTLTHW